MQDTGVKCASQWPHLRENQTNICFWVARLFCTGEMQGSSCHVKVDLNMYGAAAGLVAAAPAGAPVREYYIAAERDLWNFAPQGLVDNCTGAALEDEQTVCCPRVVCLWRPPAF